MRERKTGKEGGRKEERKTWRRKRKSDVSSE